MKFKIGDRIRIVNARGLTGVNTSSTGIKSYETIGHAGVIVDYQMDYNRYRIKYTDLFNTQGNNVIYWLHQDDIQLDKEFYRDEKLEQLL